MNLPGRTVRLPVALALLALLCLPALAAAHAELVESDPPDGGTISDPPYTLVARFSEELGTERSRIVVRDAAGEEVARGGISDEDPHLMIVDLSGLPRADYRARWTAVTPADNGVTRGTIDFTIAAAASPRPTTAQTSAVTPIGPASSPTGGASPGGTPAASPSAPTPSPEPTPGTAEPTAGTADLVVALVLAGLLLAALAYMLWRRRTA